MQVGEYFSELLLFGGPIGINLKSCLGGKGAYVDSFYKEPFGGVKIGDILWQINGTQLDNVSIEEIRQIVKIATGPVKLVFKSFPPLILREDTEPSDQIDDNHIKNRLDHASLQLLHDLRGRSWIKRIVKHSYFEASQIYQKYSVLYESYQLLQTAMVSFSEDEMSSIVMSRHDSLNNDYSYCSAKEYINGEVEKMISGSYSSTTNYVHDNSTISDEPLFVSSNSNDLRSLLNKIKEEYVRLVKEEILPLLQNILISENPSLLKYRSYLYYQLKDLSFPTNDISPIFPFISPLDILNSKSGELLILIIFLLSMKKFEAVELFHRFIHFQKNHDKANAMKAKVEVLVMLFRDKLLMKFYESDHYSRLISQATIKICCSNSIHSTDLKDTDDRIILPLVESNVQVIDLSLNFLLSDIGISSCTSIHRPRNEIEEKSVINSDCPILLCLNGVMIVDPIRNVLDNIQTSLWVGLRGGYVYDECNSHHLVRFVFPQLPNTGVLVQKTAFYTALDVPINFALQNFHFPDTSREENDDVQPVSKLLFGCSVLTFDEQSLEGVLKSSSLQCSSISPAKYGSSPNRVIDIDKPHHRSSFSDSDLFQAAFAQASSLKSFASKVVTGASTYLPTLGSSSEDPVEIEMEEYSRSYIRYSESDPNHSSFIDITSETKSELGEKVALEGEDITSTIESTVSKRASIPFHGFCILSQNGCLLSDRQRINHIWKEYENYMQNNSAHQCDSAKTGEWLEQHCMTSTSTTNDDKQTEFGLSFIKESLNPQMLIIVFFAFVMEIKILLVSEEASISSHVILGEWLKKEIFPLKYDHIYAPVIGLEVAQQVITCPAPYFAGISLQTFNTMSETIESMDLIVFNLTENTVSFPRENNSSEIQLLQEIYHNLRHGNPIFDSVQREMKPTISILAERLPKTRKITTANDLYSDEDSSFPSSVVRFRFADERKSSDKPQSSLNQVISELVFGLEFCLLKYDCVNVNNLNAFNTPVILNESLFMKLKRIQMDHPANTRGLLLGPALGKFREGLIKGILRSQAWSTYITQPKD